MNNTPSQKSIYIWNLLGNFAAAAVSVLYLLIECKPVRWQTNLV